MSFAKDIWDGIDKVSEHITTQLKVASDLADMMKYRAKYEEDYAKHMTELGKQLPGGKNPAAAKTETTMHAAIEAVVSSHASLAKVHAELAIRLTNDVVKPFAAFLKAKDADRKRLLKEGEAKSKALKNLENTAKKAQEAYEKAAADARKAVAEEKKALAALSEDPNNKKLQSAAPKATQLKKKALDRMAQAEKIAESAVTNVNEGMQKTYDTEMPEILTEMQKLSEEVFEKIAEFLAIFTDAHEQFETPYKEAYTLLSENAKEKLDKEADLNEFIEKAKSEKEKYELVEFNKIPNPEEEEDEEKKEEPAAAAAAAEEPKKEEEKKEEEKKEEEKKEEEKKEEEKKEEEKKEEEKKEEEKPKEEEKKEEEKPAEEKKEEEKPAEEKKEEEKPAEEEKKEEEKPAEEEKKEDA